MFVTVRLEDGFRRGEPHWVARDEDNAWRCYAAKQYATTASEAVYAMFHAEEIANVIPYGGKLAVAEIK
jgi:hypothetical protein